MRKIANAGRIAPSGSNIQPREFVIVTESEKIKKLSKVQETFEDFTAAIAVVCDPEKSDWWLEDMAAAVENMLLAVVALGYDSVWIEGTLLEKEDWTKNLLEIPEEKRLMTILPIGKAASNGTRAKKKEREEVLHYETYGNRSE